MESTTHIVKFTPAVLRAICKQKNMTKKQYRKAVLIEIRTKLAMFLQDPEVVLMKRADREFLEDIIQSARLAIGDE